VRWLLLLLLCAACSAEPTRPDATGTSAQMATEEPYYPPDFSMTTLDGAPMRLSDLRGRWVVINFWATWCEPCIREIPTLGRIADEYADTLTILGVNMREERAQVTAFVRDLGVRYPILVNPDDETLVTYTVVGLPQTLIIAPDGELVWRSFGEVEYESFAASLHDLQRAFRA